MSDPLLFDQMKAEWAQAHVNRDALLARIARLERSLGGIASCATQCGCCRMHVQIALEALQEKTREETT
jgi:hypothetical protein